MITEFKCENCKCITSIEKGIGLFVEIDEEKKKTNEEKKKRYNFELIVYNKDRDRVRKRFEEIVEKHNKLCFWWNLKKPWVFSIYFCSNECQIQEVYKIQEGYGYSTNYIERVEFIKPNLNIKYYRYIECPVCGERKYLKDKNKKYCCDYF